MLAEHLETKVWEIVDSYYPRRDWAHGRSHIERVLRTAVEIGKREGADTEIIELSAILHDIFANEEKHTGVEGFRHEIEASKEARNILKTLRFEERTIDAVCHCIESHRKRTGKIQPQTIEARNIRPDGTVIDFAQHSSNIEYELSIKEVAKRMYTETGKRLARERAVFMDEFYSRLGKELKGII